MLNHPTGSRMIAAGHINATGTGNTIYSPTTFRPTAQVHVNAGGSLILEGPMRYEGGSFTGAGVLVQNGEGHVVAPTTINTSIFDFDGSFEAAVWTLESDLTLDVGQLENSTINTNVFDGTIEAKSDSTLTLNLAGGSQWEMHGTLAVGTGNALELRVAGVPVKLAGTVFVGTGSQLTFDADVSGSVQFNGGGTVVFNGANNPGNSPGVQRFEGDVTFGPSSLLTIEVASQRTEDHDRLEASGKLTLDGMLKVETIGDAALRPGDRFVIAKYGGLEGEFDGIQAPLLGDGMMFALDYGASELSLVYTMLGDFDADFRVTRADAAIVAANFGMENGATISHGDLDGDGRVGISDAAIFQANFGRSIADFGAARRAAVPEPTSIVLVAIGSIFAVRFLPVTKSRRRAT